MAREAFLINPPTRRLKKGLRIRSKSSRHKNAWYESSGDSVISRPYGTRHAAASVKGYKRKGIYARAKVGSLLKRRKSNPLGSEVLIVGANPKKRKRSRVRSRRRKSNPIVNRARKRSSNPRLNRVRRRRNPISLAGFSPMSYLMPVGIGLAGHIAVQALPKMLKYLPNADGTMNFTRVAVQVGAAVAGGFFLKGDNKKAWIIGAAIALVTELMGSTVNSITGTTTTFAGFGAFPSFPVNVGMQQRSLGYSGLGAFPQEFGSYADQTEDILPYN